MKSLLMRTSRPLPARPRSLAASLLALVLCWASTAASDPGAARSALRMAAESSAETTPPASARPARPTTAKPTTVNPTALKPAAARPDAALPTATQRSAALPTPIQPSTGAPSDAPSVAEAPAPTDTALDELAAASATQPAGPAPSPLEDDAVRGQAIAAATPERAQPHPWIPANVEREWAHASGLALYALGDAEAARRVLTRSIALGRVDEEAWHMLGLAQLQSGDFAAAQGALLAALDHTSSPEASARIHRDLAELALLGRRPAHAVVALERAAELTPGDRDIAQLLARAQHAANPETNEAPEANPRLRTALAPVQIHRDATALAERAMSQLPELEQTRIRRAASVLARPESERRAWMMLAGLVVLLAGIRLARGHGDLVIAIEYPAELRGTFTVRLTRGARRRRTARTATRRHASADVLKGGASTRTVHTMVSRETQYRRLRPGRYSIELEGLLQAQESEEILADLIEARAVAVRGRRATRVEFDLQPSEGAVDFTVLWDKRPVKDAGVVALSTPGSLRYARNGPVRLSLIRGKHRIAVGSGDRIAIRDVEIDSYQPQSVSVDLAGGDNVLFKGCPPAVELYLRGDVPGAAAALDREGQVHKGQLLLAQHHESQGRAQQAAEHYELAEHWVEAAELWASLDEPGRAAPLLERADDPARAAEMYRRAGELTAAGESFERARDFEAAVGCYRDANEVTRWIDALERSGMIYEASQVALERTERRRAIRLLQQVLPEDPRFAEAAVQLSGVLEEEGHIDLAAEKLAEYVRATGERASADVQWHLAELLDQTGETDRSLGVLEALRQRDPTHPHLATRIEALRKRRGEELDAASQRQSLRNLQATAPLMGPSRYDILEEVGRGAMGVVYRAHDKRLEREVALKKMPKNLREHPKAIEFFLREAQAVARLSHRNIVTLYDVDQEDDVFFLTMELLQGQPLNVVLKRQRRIGPRDVAKLGIQVATGLAYAHSKGVVHRDIKTANLFLTNEKTVTIMDFGLAKMVEEVRKGSTIVGGTPFYMAPEQAAGKPVDHRVDLYALGVTLFELLTGRVPFEDGDVAYHHRSTAPPDPRSLVEGTPDALAELILALLSKDPDLRPASANEVKQRLEKIVRTRQS